MQPVANTALWIGFSVFVVLALVSDMLFLTKVRDRSERTIRQALGLTIFWVVLAFLFNLFLWGYLYVTTTPQFAHTQSLAFLTGYLIEKSLSVDNLFVFYLIFHQFRIPPQYQQRVFTYGIWGAITMRLGLILIGTWLVAHFHWLLYLMGAFLFFTGVKLCFSEENKKDLAETLLFRWIKRHFRVTTEFHGESFFVRQGKHWAMTPLFVALIFIEISDLVFAFDSIPAIFAITQDPFLVWSSNVFAILGLRALYFVLARMIEKLQYLKYGIALILAFVGFKLMAEPFFKIPTAVSLLTVLMIITVFTAFSVWKMKKEEAKPC